MTTTSKNLKIIFAPSNLGYIKSNTAQFPSYLIKKGLFPMLNSLNIQYEKEGTIKPEKVKSDEFGDPKCKFGQQIAQFNQKIAQKVGESIKTKNDLLLIIGGDHSIAIGTIAGILQKRKKTGLLWLDAHPDIHTHKTTQTGWVYGMPLAAICGYGKKNFLNLFNNSFINPKNTVIFAAQYIDKKEYQNIKKFGVHLITINDIIEQGIGKCLQKAIRIITKNTDYVHVSLDLDVIDERFAPGTPEYSLGQLTYREIKYVLKKLAEKNIISSMDIVEGDPQKDIKGKTANLTLELIATLLSKSYSPYDQYLMENKIN